MAATHSQLSSVCPEGIKTFNFGWATTPVSKPLLFKTQVGHTLLQAITSVHTEHLDKVCVSVNGITYDRDKWNYQPKETDIVVATLVPNDPVSLGFTLGQLAFIIGVGVAAVVVGYLLFRPETPKNEDANRIPSLRGAKNTMRKYEPFRAVSGKRIIAPDYLAEPYTVRRGQNEWLRLLLCVGYGPLKLENFRIGETSLDAYEHNIAWIDHYENTDESAVRALWPNDVVEDAPNITILGPSSSINSAEIGVTDGPRAITRQLANGTDRVIAEFMLTKGLIDNDQKDKYNSVGVEHSYFDPVLEKTIKIVRISRNNSGRYRPQAGTLIRMSGSGSYKTTDTYRLVSQFRYAARTTRLTSNSIQFRSWTFPSSAILKIDGNLAHIDMGELEGKTKQCRFYNESDDNGNPIITSTTYNVNQGLAAWAHLAKSPKQYRGDVTYTPVGGDASNLVTQTGKIFPRETPNDAGIQDEVLFTKIRSIRNQTESQFQQVLGYGKPLLNVDGVKVRNFRPVVIAVEVKATDQLSGMIDTFNVESTMCVPQDWEADWRNWPSLSIHPSENPADAFRWQMQGPWTDSPLPNERIDLDGLEDWRDVCNQPAPDNVYDGAQWRISYANQEESTLQVELQKIAFTGRAEYSFDDLRHGVVQKVRQETPVQIFTPKNSWGFQANRSYPEVVDGVRFEFDNELKEYQQDENIFFDPRITENNRLGKTAGITLQGIPDADMAYRLARLTFYEQTLQREAYKFTTDIEGLVARRGSLVRIQHDVLDVGLGSGRVLEKGDGFIRIDEVINLEENTVYGLQFRLSDGVIPPPVQATYTSDGVFTVDNSDIEDLLVGDFLTYGDLGLETIDALVVGIEYGQDTECSMSLVNYDQNVYNFDDDPALNPIPEFNSRLNLRSEWLPPEPPQLTTLDEEAGINISLSQLYLSIEYEAQLDQPAESFYFQARSVLLEDDDFEGELSVDSDDGADWEFAGIVPEGETNYVFNEIQRGTGYRFRARTRGRENFYSRYSDPVNVIIPLDFPPPNVQNLEFKHTIDGIVLTWDRVADPDLADYEIRTNTNVGEVDGLVDNVTSVRDNVGYNDEEVTYYVYARTIYNSYSLQATEVVVPTFYVPPVLSGRQQDDSLNGTRVRWVAISTSSTFPREYLTGYEVRTDTDVGEDDGLETFVTETAFNAGYIKLGEEPTYYIYAKSVGGYYSPTGLEIVPDAPPVNAVESLLGVPIDNTAILDWEEPDVLIYPIRTYNVEEQLPGRNIFESVGSFSATYATLVEREGGNYTYRVRPVDFAGNVGPWREVALRLFNPTDFVLIYSKTVDIADGDVVNGVIDFDPEGISRAYFPLSTTKTVQDYIDEVEALSPPAPDTIFFDDETIFFDDETVTFELIGGSLQDKNDFVGVYTPQLTLTGEGYYEKVFDIFDGQPETDLFIRDNVVEIGFDWQYIQQNQEVEVRSTIEWSEDGVTWIDEVDGTQVFIEDEFRYVRVRIYFDATDNTSGLPFVRLNSLDINIDIKQRTDQGEADIVGAGDPNFPTEIPFSKVRDANTGEDVNIFIDVLAVNATIEYENNDDEPITVYTEFEYREDPNDPTSPIVRDRFKAYAQNTDTGAFVPARISWIARGF